MPPILCRNGCAGLTFGTRRLRIWGMRGCREASRTLTVSSVCWAGLASSASGSMSVVVVAGRPLRAPAPVPATRSRWWFAPAPKSGGPDTVWRGGGHPTAARRRRRGHIRRCGDSSVRDQRRPSWRRSRTFSALAWRMLRAVRRHAWRYFPRRAGAASRRRGARPAR